MSFVTSVLIAMLMIAMIEVQCIRGQGLFAYLFITYLYDVDAPAVKHGLGFRLIGRLYETLNEMEQNGVIREVDEPTDWVNSLIIENQNPRKLRVSLDPRSLNKGCLYYMFYGVCCLVVGMICWCFQSL
jgi:hypothetical protein